MKFQIIISVHANRFFFVSNLSEWHFSCRSVYNRAWNACLRLGLRAKKSLRDFRRIIRAYGFEPPHQYLGIPFFSLPERQVWHRVKRLIGSKEYQKLYRIFLILEPYFQTIWVNEKLKLETMQIHLKRFISSNLTRITIQTINMLGGGKLRNQPKVISVFLLLSVGKGYGGSALTGKDIIMLECSDYPSACASDLVPMVLHEVAHLILDRSAYRSLLTQFLKEKCEILRALAIHQFIPDAHSLLNEVTVSSFLPEGYLSEKYFGIDVRARARQRYRPYDAFPFHIFSCLRYFCAYTLYPLAKRYAENKKPIDRQYLDHVLLAIKRFSALYI